MGFILLSFGTLQSFKKSEFCLKTSYFTSKQEHPSCNFARGAIVFKVSVFYYFGPKSG